MDADYHQYFSALNNYHPDSDRYDELSPFSDNSEMPDYWHAFFRNYEAYSAKEYATRTNDLARILRDNGVTYNIYDNVSDEAHKWHLDPIPYIISAEDWRYISEGLVQRAQLFNLLLRDIYGEQSLISNGIVPQELIYQHPGYIRNCKNVCVPGDCYLHFYAADLARSSDGQFWVIGDRSQAPSGSGYALENRSVMSTAFTEYFKSLPIARLGSYFNAVYDELVRDLPKGIRVPKVILLTSGVGNEAYFEHSYLANYLGISLVQGNDLMVRGDHLYLKTLAGLERVDVILRRLDDVYCDPLELKSDSVLGVPGLMHVVRCGHVVIKNAIGSSVVENAALMPFLNNISRYFGLGDLKLPSLATWWCGQPNELAYVLDNIGSLIIKKIYRTAYSESMVVDGASLNPQQLCTLKNDIMLQPYLYVGQEKVHFSSIPTTIDNTIGASHAVFRSFLVRDQNGYMVMPGGLTRSGKESNNIIISNQLGSASKDTWVITAKEQSANNQIPIKKASRKKKTKQGTLPSHAAESLYWLGRYTERLISNGRLLRSVIKYLSRPSATGMANDKADAEMVLLKALTLCTYTYPGFLNVEDDQECNPWTELQSLVFDEHKSGSLAHHLISFQNTFLVIREFWSSDVWKIYNEMKMHWQHVDIESEHGSVATVEKIDQLITAAFAFLGLYRESARRLEGWTIFDLGRKLEQSLSVIMQIKSIFIQQRNEAQQYDLIETILTSNQNLTTYRYIYRDSLQLDLMLDLLLKDVDNPRSLTYLLEKLQQYIQALPKLHAHSATVNTLNTLISEAVKLVEDANITHLSKCKGKSQKYEALESLMNHLYQLLLDVGNAISKAYFKHTNVPQQLFNTPAVY